MILKNYKTKNQAKFITLLAFKGFSIKSHVFLSVLITESFGSGTLTQSVFEIISGRGRFLFTMIEWSIFLLLSFDIKTPSIVLGKSDKKSALHVKIAILKIK